MAMLTMSPAYYRPRVLYGHAYHMAVPYLTRYALDFAPVRWELPWHLLDAVLSLQPAPADTSTSASASASASASTAAAPTPGVGGSAAAKETEVL